MITQRAAVVVLVAVILACGMPVRGQTPEELIAIHEAQLEAMNAHDLDTMMSYWAEDGMYLLVHSPPAVPKAYVRGGFAQRFAARPDFHMVMSRVLAAEGVVVEEGLTVYTDAAVGVEVVIPHISIYDFAGDKIKMVTSYNDQLGSMVLRGEIPAPEMPDFTPSIDVPAHEATGLSPLEANAEHIRRWNSHDAASMAKIYHADCTIFAGPLGMELDRVAMTAMNEVFFSAFPDVELEIIRTIDLADGWVLTELLWQATHQGTFFGIPPMGYATENRGVWLVHYTADGLVSEGAFYYDNLTLMTQMTTPEWPLDGIWVSTVPTPLGNLVMTTTYVAQDAARTMYSGSLEEINAMPLLAEIYPDADPTPKWAGGHAVKVGRHQYEAIYLGYSVKIVDSEIGRTTEFVGLFTVKAYFQLTGPDQLSGQGMASYYLAGQDADRDGFPDDGEEPVVCVPWEWTGRRLTTMPGCVPTSMP